MTSSTISSTISPEPPPAFTFDQKLPLRWTSDHVAMRLIEALRTLDRMPRPKGPRSTGNHWPRHRLEWADQLAQAELPEVERRARAAERLSRAFHPSGAEIARMDRVLDWLREMRGDDAEQAMLLTLWALRTARRRPLRALCRELGLTPPTFYKRKAEALDMLADKLETGGVGVF